MVEVLWHGTQLHTLQFLPGGWWPPCKEKCLGAHRDKESCTLVALHKRAVLPLEPIKSSTRSEAEYRHVLGSK